MRLVSKVGCTSEIKINAYLFCIPLDLHYLCTLYYDAATSSAAKRRLRKWWCGGVGGVVFKNSLRTYTHTYARKFRKYIHQPHHYTTLSTKRKKQNNNEQTNNFQPRNTPVGALPAGRVHQEYYCRKAPHRQRTRLRADTGTAPPLQALLVDGLWPPPS